jgi:ATP-binding cassette subfamily C protein LapB
LNDRALQPMMKLTGIWVQAENISAAKARVAKVLSLPQQPDAPTRRIQGAISARDATLRLDERESSLFAGLTFRIEPGQCLAVTGGDGAGKSSLLRVLLGEQILTSGAILIDGAKLVDLSKVRGAGGIAYVDASPVIFQGSILRNIALSDDPKATREGMAMARAIGMNEAINHLPHGFETMIGPQSGSAYSLGFFQQIALARVLARKPKIMIFNEANTAMDRSADAAALQALAALGGETTVVLVSRRPSYIALADIQVHVNGAQSTVRSQRKIAPDSPIFSFECNEQVGQCGAKARQQSKDLNRASEARAKNLNPEEVEPDQRNGRAGARTVLSRVAKARAAVKRAQNLKGRPVRTNIETTASAAVVINEAIT